MKGKSVDIVVEYPWIPKSCTKCNIFGHSHQVCGSLPTKGKGERSWKERARNQAWKQKNPFEEKGQTSEVRSETGCPIQQADTSIQHKDIEFVHLTNRFAGLENVHEEEDMALVEQNNGQIMQHPFEEKGQTSEVRSEAGLENVQEEEDMALVEQNNGQIIQHSNDVTEQTTSVSEEGEIQNDIQQVYVKETPIQAVLTYEEVVVVVDDVSEAVSTQLMEKYNADKESYSC
ncbi:hypothetical protein FRX31_027395 [Thalictrum thalictroides]|uniref:DUF4283 domain-containing protein n=1 Tax=Thalictrum thalictroides TaxID=46969 RepID=A0A7J6VE31_THATH|nr:hypothetical protein FRX31_027395 [Thalictrum thalictroides]